jgi:hypothetical protein
MRSFLLIDLIFLKSVRGIASCRMSGVSWQSLSWKKTAWPEALDNINADAMKFHAIQLLGHLAAEEEEVRDRTRSLCQTRQ